MRTPFPPPSDHLQPIRISLAIVLTGSAFLASGSLAVRLYFLTQAHQQQRTDQMHQTMLSEVEYHKAAQDYRTCMTVAQQIPAGSLFHSRAKILRAQCEKALTTTVMQRAETKAAAGHLKDAIAEIETVSSGAIADGAVTDRAEQFVWEWSKQILQIAEGYYFDPNGKWQEAVRTAGAITFGNPLYDEAQAKIRSWQQEWFTNESQWQAAEASFKANQLETALFQAQQITHPHWRQRASTLIQAIHAQQAATEQSNHQASNADSTETGREINLNSSAPLLLPLAVGLLLLLASFRSK
jgi:hypothetical protein